MAKRKATKQNNLTKNNLVLPRISPLTTNQDLFFNTFSKFPHHLLLGAAGTGKTYLSLYKALSELQSGNIHKLIIFRSSVASRDMGFLPGTAEEKLSVFETPYRVNVNNIFKRDDAYDILKKQHVIQFESTSFQRGTTLDNSIILIDECQNMSAHELDTLITRTGENSRILICGDLLQQDITKHSEKNVNKVLSILADLPSFNSIHFTLEDIVRSGVVKEYLTQKQLIYPHGY